MGSSFQSRECAKVSVDGWRGLMPRVTSGDVVRMDSPHPLMDSLPAYESKPDWANNTQP